MDTNTLILRSPSTFCSGDGSAPDTIDCYGATYFRVPSGVDWDECDLMLVPRDVSDTMEAVVFGGYGMRNITD